MKNKEYRVVLIAETSGICYVYAKNKREAREKAFIGDYEIEWNDDDLIPYKAGEITELN